MPLADGGDYINPTPMVSKTRDRLIEVARQLFARKGVDNTTMLDIATASKRGRRTLYTYFRNKREIHQAVVEREGEQAVARERAILQSAESPEVKLREILIARYETQRCISAQKGNDNLSLFNLLEGGRVGKIRKLVALKEIEILKTVLKEGVDKGIFNPLLAEKLIEPIVLMMLGVDTATSERQMEEIGMRRDIAFNTAVDFIVEAVKL